MVFPFPEIKFANIVRTPTKTLATVRLYRVDDGGLDAEGHQRFLRTLKRERELVLDAGWTDDRLVTTASQKFAEWASELGFAAVADRLVCTL